MGIKLLFNDDFTDIDGRFINNHAPDFGAAWGGDTFSYDIESNRLRDSSLYFNGDLIFAAKTIPNSSSHVIQYTEFNISGTGIIGTLNPYRIYFDYTNLTSYLYINNTNMYLFVNGNLEDSYSAPLGSAGGNEVILRIDNSVGIDVYYAQVLRLSYVGSSFLSGDSVAIQLTDSSVAI